MLAELIKRGFNLMVVGLAALAFFFLPVGRKTSAQHLADILRTPPAREAATAFADAARQIVARARANFDPLVAPSAQAPQPRR